MRVSGVVTDISGPAAAAPYRNFLTIDVGNGLSVIAYFRRLWPGQSDELSGLRRGDKVTVAGTIGTFLISVLDLDDCELQ